MKPFCELRVEPFSISAEALVEPLARNNHDFERV